MGEKRIRVKFVSNGKPELWLHQFPGGEPVWGRCEFLFDRELRDYDWLLVYEHLSPAAGQHKKTACERLACPKNQSIFVTAEPSTIKFYGHDFTRQFGAVLTSQEPWALPHPDRIYSQPALHWFYGISGAAPIPFDDIERKIPDNKSELVSMVYSPKSMGHTLHRVRNRFMREMIDTMPELSVFGRTMTPLPDKSQALDDFKYHIALENHIGPHHWTEKLADAYLGLTLPFYAGCTNLSDYFPAESFIPIDMEDPAGAVEIMRQAIADNEYEKRLPAIVEARRRVLHEQNLFAVASREIERRDGAGGGAAGDAVVFSRYALRKERLATRLSDVYGKLRLRYLQRRLRMKG